MEKRYEETTYIISHNGADIVHPMVAGAGSLLVTGQPYLEDFTDEESWVSRLRELGKSDDDINMLTSRGDV